MSHLINFYGTECPHCERMEPIITKFEQETGVTVERKEVWHDEENYKLFQELDKDGGCGGVPFFMNKKTGKTICGEATFDELKAWADEK